jgi:hypothetical protein
VSVILKDYLFKKPHEKLFLNLNLQFMIAYFLVMVKKTGTIVNCMFHSRIILRYVKKTILKNNTPF